MKKIYFIASIAFISYTISSCASAPDVCDCIKNASKVRTPEYDANFQKECEDYSHTLSDKENRDRIQDALKRGCL
ncbi:MAG: hypothetical protein ACOYO1_06620 [Bacteroidales bacterium]